MSWRWWIFWFAGTLAATALLWKFAFGIRDIWVEFQLFDETLISVESDESQLARDLSRLRWGVSLAVAMLSFAVALAIRLTWKWSLTRWLTPETNPALLGGWLVCLMGWFAMTSRLPIPDTIEVSLFVWIVLVIIFYGLLVTTVLATLHWTENRTGRVAKGIRGVILALAFAAGSLALLAVVAVLAIQGLSLLLGI